LVVFQADEYLRYLTLIFLPCSRSKALIDKLLRHLYKLVHKLDARKFNAFASPLALSHNPDILPGINLYQPFLRLLYP
jgi:hypothetical protein